MRYSQADSDSYKEIFILKGRICLTNTQKLITFAVPCYNSADYMHNCVDSLLGAGDDTEIIIIDDGSTDETPAIADRYAARYPEKVRVIHQENGGHGEGVNQGLRHAAGLFYKVVDSDDRLDPTALNRLLTRMREHQTDGTVVDMYVCNYVYDHWDGSKQKVMRYKNVFPEEKVVTWDKTHRFLVTQYLMMHSVIYRTALLRECGIVLPKHTFYVDNLYMYQPFPSVRSIYYMNLNLYLYFIGRADQSVTEQNMIKRIDQQLLVTRRMLDCHDLGAVKRQSRRLYSYMMHEMALMVCISSIFLYKSGTEENYRKAEDLWAYIKQKDIKTYRKLSYQSLCIVRKFGKRVSVLVYSAAHRIFRFN